MTNTQLRKAVIARLWELCDGAEPARALNWDDDYGPVGGICPDIEVNVDGNAKLELIPDGPGRCLAKQALVDMGMEGDLAFPAEDWGNGRRLLAGFLACWLSDKENQK